MAPATCHLPNGQNLTVTPVFGGLSFKSNELSNHRSAFPPGWTIVLNEEDGDQEEDSAEAGATDGEAGVSTIYKKHAVHRWKRPTLDSDHLFISSISNPSSSEFRPASSPTRQIAMMLWATLYWYFHQQEPDRKVMTSESANTAEEGRPRGEWRVHINKEGIFKGKNLLAKLERMGLITTEDSSVGCAMEDKSDVGYSQMFVTRRAFWQVDARIYLFTLSPVAAPHSPYPSTSPFSSRPSSPMRDSVGGRGRSSPVHDHHIDPNSPNRAATPLAGPYLSTSHLPTYYPPHPTQYVFTNGIRHPLRPKPYRQGETIYTRYVPSVGQYISFRIASMSSSPVVQHGPWLMQNAMASVMSNRDSLRQHVSESSVPTMSDMHLDDGSHMCDVDLLHKWMNEPRVAHSWGVDGPREKQEKFLKDGLSSRHSFPVIGSFDGKPFGYFEIYWVKEDILGKYLGGDCGEWNRGIHCLVGEQDFRGSHRVRIWLSALLHYCWISDMRTECVMMEPRVDNVKLLNYCEEVGFHKAKEIAFPHKQANLMRITRDTWEKPFI